ncbi:MAG: gene transfer agent family protein [Alteromonadaceae bacterium]|nr:gene transfer agent family protein [Alteromonadaceae bacterium]
MANKQRGYVEITSGGKNYPFRLTTNVLCELEELVDQPIAEFFTKMKKSPPTMKEFRAIVLCGLRGGASAKSRVKLDLNCAGEIIDGAGGMVGLMSQVGEAMGLASPDADDNASADDDASEGDTSGN